MLRTRAGRAGSGILRAVFQRLQALRLDRTRALRLAAIALAGGGLVCLYLGTAKRVQFIIDGRAYAATTHAATVAGALHDAGWDVGLLDRVQPPAEASVPSGGTIRLDHAAGITIDAAGQSRQIETAERIPANILAAAGVLLLPGDGVWADGLRLVDTGAPLPKPPERLRVRSAILVTINIDGATHWLRTEASTWGEALVQAGIDLHQGDRMIPGADAAVVPGAAGQILRSVPITIQVDGDSLTARAAGPTVGEALIQSGVPLVGLDYSIPGAAQPIPADGQVRVVRVVEQILIEEKPLPFQTKTILVPDVEIDQQKVVDPGAYGLQASRIRVRLEDGVEKSRQVDGEWVALEPRTRTIGYGTKIVIRTMNTPDGPIQYWRALNVYATSYSPCRSASPDGRCMSGTSSGRPVQKGMIAARYWWYIRLGNEPVYVPGYGFGSIGDVGGGIPGVRWIDLGYSDSDWQEWGSYVTLYFLTPVPADTVPILP